MTGFEPLDAERADAAGRKLVERGAPHGAQSDHDDVCGARHAISIQGSRRPACRWTARFDPL